MSNPGPKDQEVIDLATSNQIDQVCDAFEGAWLSGARPSIEDYIDRCEAIARNRLLVELLLVDRECRIRSGEVVTRSEYLTRFPEYTTLIDSVEFATVDDCRRNRRQLVQEQAALVVGATFGRFKLLEQLGAGSSGTVWKAYDSQLGRSVALKIPRQSQMSATERQRFIRESRACARLQHPNIVAVYEVGEHLGRLFIVSELIEGANLRVRLESETSRCRAAAQICTQLAEALSHAHEHGVIHRDLKPANIIVDINGCPHIADFGLAKWMNESVDLTIEGNILGTPAYMSPEQARGDSYQADCRTDIYGLGAILYELTTGAAPFAGDVATIVHRILHDEPVPPRTINRDVPRDLETICLKAMEKTPSRRYSSASEMAVDLCRFERGEPVLARRTSTWERSYRWISRRKALSGMIASTFVAASALSVASNLSTRNRELLGRRTVSMVVDPTNAEVVFARLNETTGTPEADQITWARTSNPVVQELIPGDYLVVARVGERFHEVFRHIPKVLTDVPLAYPHRRWSVDSSGAIRLPRVTIPPASVSRSMVKVDEFKDVPSTNHACACLFDPNPFTVGQFRVLNKGFPLTSQFYESKHDDELLCVPYDHAVFVAELVGKRLPMSCEYDWVFEELCRLAGSKSINLTQLQSFPVAGLLNGNSEWTQSFKTIATNGTEKATAAAGFVDYRVVRCGREGILDRLGTEPPTRIDQVANSAQMLSRYTCRPGLGFRCARSIGPRFFT